MNPHLVLLVSSEPFNYFNWFGLPLIIFFSRIGDVTIGTIRHVFISKGFRRIVPLLGFVEVLIWIVVVAQVMKNLNNWACYIGWAGGFAAGTYFGLLIEERLALGLQIVRIITSKECDQLIVELKLNNHGITIVDGHGAQGPVKIILSVVDRSHVNSMITIINRTQPSAFYSIEDIRETGLGVFSDLKGSSVLQRIFSSRK